MTRVLYFVPTLNLGGAERGLLTLVKCGFFEGTDMSVVALRRGAGAVEEPLAALQVPVTVLFEDYHAMTCLPMAPARLRSLIGEVGPDVLIMSLPLANVIGRVALPRRARPYRISFEHSVRYDRRMYSWLIKLLSGRIDGVMADCPETLESIECQTGGFSGKEQWVAPLVTFSDLTPLKSSYLLADPVRILSVGRLVPDKRHDLALEAVAALEKTGVRISYTIIGDGRERASLLRIASKLGIADQVDFAGERSNWLVEAPAYDLLLITSAREGLCLTALESMACGLPLAAPDIGGIRSYGVDGENMVKLTDMTPPGIAMTLARLIGDASLRESIGRGGARDARRLFSEDRVRSQLREIRTAILSATHRKQQGP